MEGVGLAVGLVGLFSTCLEALDKVDSWRNYEYESGSLDAQFRVQKILFQRWGEAVGLGTKDIDGKEKEISSDPDACEIVKKLLQSIKQIESWGDSTSPLPMHEAEKSRVRGRVLLSDSRLNTFFRSTKKKFGWSLRGKDKRKFQVEQLSALVSALANLIPIPEDGGQDSTNTQSIHTNGMSRNDSIQVIQLTLISDDTLNSSVERGMKGS